MTRFITGLAAWLAGTALAVSLAWFGANMVVRDAGTNPGVQVIDADPAAPATVPATIAPPTVAPPAVAATAPSASGTPAATGRPRSTAAGRPTPAASGSTSSSPSPSPSAAATTAGSMHSYTMDGGRVVLDVNGDSASLVTAVPDSGFSVQTWSGTDWLRVDFSSGAQVSSLIASWYLHAPTVTVTN
jgi:hypothetical protein